MKFREHRGMLADSMETAVEVDGLEGLLRHLKARFADAPYMCDYHLKAEPYGGDDDRIGWKNVHIVMDGNGVVGFTDGPLDTL